MMKILKKTRGSIALISMLIIATFTLILAISMTEASISSGYEQLNHSVGKFAYNYAEGCFEEAIHQIEQDVNFSGYTLNFTDGSCGITVSGTNPKTVDVTLNYLDYVQRFRGSVNVSQVGHAINATLSAWSKI